MLSLILSGGTLLLAFDTRKYFLSCSTLFQVKYLSFEGQAMHTRKFVKKFVTCR